LTKRRALRASAFHFLFRAEGRVTPGRRERLGVGRGMLRGGGTASVTCGRPHRMNQSIDLSIPRQHGRVTPGRAAAMRWVPGMVPVPGRSRTSTARSRVLRVYERRLRDPIAPTELRGTPSEGVYDFGVGRWVSWALGVGSPGRWALGLLGVGRWACGRATPGALTGDEATLLRLRQSVPKPRSCAPRWCARRRARCTAGLAAAGRWVLGAWALGVGCLGVGRAAGSPPGAAPRRALGRSPTAGFASPRLVHLPSTSPPPPLKSE
jgi:hypothetical protein